ADANAARHPDASSCAPRDHGGNRDGAGILAKERDRQSGLVVKIADDAEPAAAADEVHDEARCLLALAMIAFDPAAPEQAAGIKIAALIPHVAIDIRVVDRAIDARRTCPGNRQ